MNLKNSIKSLIVTGLLASSVSTIAGPVTVNLNSFPYGTASVDTSKTGFVPTGMLSGTITEDGVTSEFNSFCVELAQSYSMGSALTYMVTNTGEVNGFTFTEAKRLGQLFQMAYSTIDTLDEAAAMQLAVWEITHESSTSMSLFDGSFYVENGASQNVLNLAQGWLAELPTIETTFEGVKLYNDRSQDFVTIRDTANKVPEPTSIALAFAGLSGLLLRRKKN